MHRIIYILLVISFNGFAQDTLTVDDGSIWWSKGSCSVDYRCYENIDEIIEMHCSDSITVTSIELRENTFEHSKHQYTECRAQRLADYLRGKHEMNVGSIVGTPILMTSSEMRQAIAEQNFRTIIIVFGKPEPLDSL